MHRSAASAFTPDTRWLIWLCARQLLVPIGLYAS